MTHGAQPTSKVSTPASEPVFWLCWFGNRSLHVKAKTWFEARECASNVFLCQKESVHCEAESGDGDSAPETPTVGADRSDSSESSDKGRPSDLLLGRRPATFQSQADWLDRSRRYYFRKHGTTG